MKIAILSRHASTRSTLRLVEAGAERGHEVVVVDYLRCYMRIAAHRHELFYQGEPLTDVNAIVPRIAAKYTFYGCAVVRQFEMMGVYSVNGSQAIARSRDKLRALQLLSRKGLGMPVTGIAHATDDVEGLMAEVGGAPMVVKLIEGMQGIGVVLTETHQAAKSVIEAFRSLEANILAQEFIAEAGGADLRCFVVGDRVIAAVKRQGPPGEFRSNIHRGGQASIVKLTREERQTAVRAVQATGLRVAGVDILRAKRGPLVMEVNSSPGLAGFEDTAQVDVAGAIIEHAVKHAAEGVSRDRVQG